MVTGQPPPAHARWLGQPSSLVAVWVGVFLKWVITSTHSLLGLARAVLDMTQVYIPSVQSFVNNEMPSKKYSQAGNTDVKSN